MCHHGTGRCIFHHHTGHNDMSRVLVILPTSSYRTADFVTAAANLGIDLAVASEEDPPLDLGDRFVRIDCRDPERAAAAIVALADHTPIDAVVAADDAGVIIAALASERLGLPGHPPAAAAATRDKLAMRQLLAAAEVPQPAFVAVDEDLAVDPVVYPLVLKPRTGAASQGVLRVDTPESLPAVFARVRAIADGLGESPPLLAESYIPGDEVAVEGLMVNGSLTILAVFDKPDTPAGPTFEETLLVTPSTQPPLVQTELARVVTAAVGGLGLSHGPIHAEARITSDGRVFLLEIAGRSIGGLCGRSLRFGLEGAGLEEQILAAALGIPLTTTRQPRPAGVMMLPVEAAGIVTGVDGLDEVRALPGITDVDLTTPPGTSVEPLPEGARYLGFIFAVGSTTEEVASVLRRAAATLKVRIE